MKVILWDFDGTLAYRQGKWTDTLISLATRHYPESTLSKQPLSAGLQSGFPWHQPELFYGERCSEQWWQDLHPVFSQAYQAAGLSRAEAHHLSELVKDEYTDVQYWSVFDDVEVWLTELSKNGWQHRVVSNHVPELPSIIDALGLAHHFEKVINSAELGCEKPHAGIFSKATEDLPTGAQIWMVGDNYNADVKGAENCGIAGILVRKMHESAKYQCVGLSEVANVISIAAKSSEMAINISDKSDQNAVDQIIALGYPDNIEYMTELLSWTCDPNWPIAGSIYEYFRTLGKLEVSRVLQVAEKADLDWRYSLIIQIISSYDDETLKSCVGSLKKWASETGSEECDFESIRILADNELIPASEIANIAKRNLFVYNVWIKETLEAAGKAIYSFLLGDHKL